MTPVDTSDLKYQASKDFEPNKGSTWKHPMEKDGWTLAHNSLRVEMSKMVESVQAAAKDIGTKPLEQWQIDCIVKFWNVHHEHIHAHHSNEDDLFMPYLKTRIKIDDKVSADHDELLKFMDQIQTTVNNLKVGSSNSNLDDLLKLLQEYENLMKPHLLEEEQECLPLLRAYFTPDEVAPKVQEILSHGPKAEMGSFISAMGVDTFYNEFMKQENIPFFVWYIDFRFRYNHFQKEFQVPIDALRNNVPPKQPRPFWAVWSWFS